MKFIGSVIIFGGIVLQMSFFAMNLPSPCTLLPIGICCVGALFWQKGK